MRRHAGAARGGSAGRLALDLNMGLEATNKVGNALTRTFIGEWPGRDGEWEVDSRGWYRHLGRTDAPMGRGYKSC